MTVLNCSIYHRFPRALVYKEINQVGDIWKLARISPILKIQLPVELKDYRPASILSILSKIYEIVVLEQITNFIEKNLIYHHYQSGYRKNYSTATVQVG